MRQYFTSFNIDWDAMNVSYNGAVVCKLSSPELRSDTSGEIINHGVYWTSSLKMSIKMIEEHHFSIILRIE